MLERPWDGMKMMMFMLDMDTGRQLQLGQSAHPWLQAPGWLGGWSHRQDRSPTCGDHWALGRYTPWAGDWSTGTLTLLRLDALWSTQ